MIKYKGLSEQPFYGYAHLYLQQFEETYVDKVAEAFVDIYTKLVELDTKIGISAAEQLFGNVGHLLNLDLIKV